MPQPISSTLADGNVAEEVCYWKDMLFFPHLLNLLSKRSIQVTVSFAPLQTNPANRKELARQLHAEVLKLNQAMGA